MSFSEWKMATLNDVCTVITDGSHYSPPSVSEGYYMASVKDMESFGFDFSECRKISEDAYVKLVKDGCNPVKGDVLVGKDGAKYLDDIFIYNQAEEIVILSSIAILRPDESKIMPGYLYYYLSDKTMKESIRNNYGSGSAIPRMVLKDFKRVPITIPCISVQKDIAATLSSLDDKIELNNRINKTLEEMAQAIFKSWFVDFEPFQDGEFEDSQIGRIPKGWKVGNLGEIADSQKTVWRRKDIEPGSRHVGLEHIPRHELIMSESGTIEDVSSDKLSFSKKHILFGKIRPYFHKVSIAPWNGYCSTDSIVLEPKDPDNYAFFALTVFSTEFVKYAVGISQGTKMPRAEWKSLRMYSLVIPPNKIAFEFNNSILPIIDMMILNKKENERLSKIRDSLMPKLMSGEIRVQLEEMQ